MVQPKPLDAFASLLRSLLLSRGMTATQFAKLSNIDLSLLSRILSAQRPPSNNLEHWAKVLDLHGPESDWFLELGYLARADQPLSVIFERYRQEIASLRNQLANATGRGG